MCLKESVSDGALRFAHQMRKLNYRLYVFPCKILFGVIGGGFLPVLVSAGVVNFLDSGWCGTVLDLS